MTVQCKYLDTRLKVNGVTNPTYNQEITTPVSYRLFYPNCGKINLGCSPVNGAYVAAVTVCNQRLF